jgi:hypothetical protein
VGDQLATSERVVPATPPRADLPADSVLIKRTNMPRCALGPADRGSSPPVELGAVVYMVD